MRIETQVGIFILGAIAVFFYLSFNIGALQLDGGSYYTYKVYFEDTGGLEPKSVVKIAGVAVGRVESIALLENGLAEIFLKIKKTHKLYKNSFATISQNGLIGGRTLEIDPGNSSSGVLMPGSTLSMPGKSAATVADVIEEFKEISDAVSDVVASFQNVFASPQGEKMLNHALKSASNAASRLSSFSNQLDKLAKENYGQVGDTCKSLKEASAKVEELAETLRSQSKNFADKAVQAADHFKDSGKGLDQTFKNSTEITDKVLRGDGTLGKLVTDSSLFYEVKDTVGEVKSLVNKASNLSVTVDMNSASFFRSDNSRGSIEFKLFTQSDYFYTVGLSSEDTGKITRRITTNKLFDAQGNVIDTTDNSFSLYQQARVPARKEETVQLPGEMLMSFSFCKKFHDLTLKVGMFEGTFGMSAEYDFVTKFKNFRWKTGVEVFDFKGYNRLETDLRPHVRWTNKLFFVRNLYTFFGFDDIFSKKRAAPFWGAGLTFDDDDIKYLLAFLPMSKVG